MKRPINRRSFVALATATGATTALAGTGFAQANYPDKPITRVVPAPPGGGTDLVARLYSDLLSQELGVQVLVDNKGGGNGNIGTAIVARANQLGVVLKDWAPGQMDSFAKGEVETWGKVIRDNKITFTE